MSSDSILRGARMAAFGPGAWEDDAAPRWPKEMRDLAIRRRQELRDSIDQVIAERESREEAE